MAGMLELDGLRGPFQPEPSRVVVDTASMKEGLDEALSNLP